MVDGAPKSSNCGKEILACESTCQGRPFALKDGHCKSNNMKVIKVDLLIKRVHSISICEMLCNRHQIGIYR